MFSYRFCDFFLAIRRLLRGGEFRQKSKVSKLIKFVENCRGSLNIFEVCRVLSIFPVLIEHFLGIIEFFWNHQSLWVSRTLPNFSLFIEFFSWIFLSFRLFSNFSEFSSNLSKIRNLSCISHILRAKPIIPTSNRIEFDELKRTVEKVDSQFPKYNPRLIHPNGNHYRKSR